MIHIHIHICVYLGDIPNIAIPLFTANIQTVPKVTYIVWSGMNRNNANQANALLVCRYGVVQNNHTVFYLQVIKATVEFIIDT